MFPGYCHSPLLLRPNSPARCFKPEHLRSSTSRRRLFLHPRLDASAFLVPSLHCSDGRVAAYVPPTAQCAEGAHGSAGRIRSGALDVISCNQKLTIRVQNVGQRNCTGLVGPLRKIASPRKRGNFTLQLLETHSSLRKLHQGVLDVFRSSQGRLPILCKRFGIGTARLGDLGCDLSKIEKPPAQRSRPNGLKRLPVKQSAPVGAVETKRARKRNLRVVVRNRNTDSLV